MDLITEINKNMIKKEVRAFLDIYGFEGLKQAMDNYSNLQQLYLCRTKNATSKICICEINYLQICGHLITIQMAATTSTVLLKPNWKACRNTDLSDAPKAILFL